MNDKKLLEIWKKYIDVPIYRVVSSIYYKDILKNGLNPDKNPFKKIKPTLFKLFDIIFKLEKKGFVMRLKWGVKEVTGSYAAKTFKVDLTKNFIDFAPNKESVDFYMQIYGGALTRNIKRLTKRLKEGNPKLSKKEWRTINYLDKWAEERMCENKAIYVLGSSTSFENALLQRLGLDKRKIKKEYNILYLPSPFGSFEHFKKIVSKYSLRLYLKLFKNQKFYLRVRSKIPSSEIKVLI